MIVANLLRRRRRALTMIELSVSMAIFSIVGIGAASVTLIAGRHTYETLDLIRTQDKARLIIDTLNRYLIIAEGDFIVENSGKTLRYVDPIQSLGGTSVTSKVVFDDTDNTLKFWLDETGSPIRTWYNIDTVTFSQDVSTWKSESKLITVNRIPDGSLDLVKVSLTIEPKMPSNAGKGVTEERILFARN